jgi:hypothetical protein
MTTGLRGGPGRNQGRKKIGVDRGGLVSVQVNIFTDQAEWLKLQGTNRQELIRDAIDSIMRGDMKHATEC